MAEAGYGCVFGDCTSQIRYMITDMSAGSTVTLCDEHYAPGMIPLLAAALGVDPGDFYANVERYLKAQARKAEKELADAQAATAAKGSQSPDTSPDDGPADPDPNDRLPGGILAEYDNHAEVP